MIQFVKDSVREIRHVVWPTREETKNYFMIVVTVLVLFWLYLFIASTVFYEWLHWAKEILTWWESAASHNMTWEMTQPTVTVEWNEVQTSTTLQAETVAEEVLEPDAEAPTQDEEATNAE